MALSARGELYLGPRALTTDCTSLLLQEGGPGGDFLLYTSKDLLYTLPLSDLSSTAPLRRFRPSPFPPLPPDFQRVFISARGLGVAPSRYTCTVLLADLRTPSRRPETY